MSEAAVRPSVLRRVITEAMVEAEEHGMEGQVRDEWVSIRILASPLVPLTSALLAATQEAPEDGEGVVPCDCGAEGDGIGGCAKCLGAGEVYS